MMRVLKRRRNRWIYVIHEMVKLVFGIHTPLDLKFHLKLKLNESWPEKVVVVVVAVVASDVKPSRLRPTVRTFLLPLVFAYSRLLFFFASPFISFFLFFLSSTSNTPIIAPLLFLFFSFCRNG